MLRAVTNFLFIQLQINLLIAMEIILNCHTTSPLARNLNFFMQEVKKTSQIVCGGLSLPDMKVENTKRGI
jgi:hypothetical protein